MRERMPEPDKNKEIMDAIGITDKAKFDNFIQRNGLMLRRYCQLTGLHTPAEAFLITLMELVSRKKISKKEFINILMAVNEIKEDIMSNLGLEDIEDTDTIIILQPVEEGVVDAKVVKKGRNGRRKRKKEQIDGYA